MSAQAGYWLYPVIARNLFPRLYEKNIHRAPYANAESKGVSCVIRF